jgi:diaminopropionate ammonia-lyase
VSTQEWKGAAVLANPMAGPVDAAPPSADAVVAFHRKWPGYRPTPLVSVPWLAGRLGVGDLLVKCESSRLGLPAFKMLGASWATYRALCQRLGGEPGPWGDLDELAGSLAGLRPFALAAATDGNHGRAVARTARLLGFGARIFVPEGTTAARVEAIAGEGAEVVVVAGDYDAAVARSAEVAGPRCLVISDTSWPGYEDVPRWVIEGYATLYHELDEALAAGGRHGVDAVFVPVGVGALAAATVRHFNGRQPSGGTGRAPAIVGVEPTGADCVARSLAAGRVTTVAGPHRSIMVGLNCGTPSMVAWPTVSKGLAAVVTVDDGWARSAVRDLAAAGIEAGETGAAALAGLLALRADGRRPPVSDLVGPQSTVLVVCTEGASDPAQWRRTLGVELVGADARQRLGAR